VSIDSADSAVLSLLAAVAPVLRQSGNRWYLFDVTAAARAAAPQPPGK
jgi:hypothetical protein